MKIGIEIHQRLDSHKLFCNCPSIVSETDRNPEPDVRLLRRLHTVYSELGEVDATSKQEFEKEKTFEYLVYKNCNCTVETDEEPPHALNRHALGIALEIALHLNCKPVDEIHVMRKTIIDGSNTSGFQRTAIIALDGRLETSRGAVGISQISIEEESAGIVGIETGISIFRLDRLGIPLVEITTDPDIKDEAHLSEVAERIGMVMRATGKVARGLGTIRQDLNVSTEGGARVEIKGAQDLKLLPILAKEEVRRQTELLRVMTAIRAKSGGKIIIPRNFANITGIFRNTNTNSKLIKNGIGSGSFVFGLVLPHHAGLVGKEIQMNRRYGSELSDYAKSGGAGGIIHSDELMEKYSISESEVSEIRKTLGVKEGDAFVLVIAPERVARKALEAVCKRAEMERIPNETRRANPDGSTSYMRPLAGGARLYPETDIPPITVTKELLEGVEAGKGESLDEKKQRLLKMLNPEMAEKMIKSRNLPLFEKLASAFRKTEPMLIANTLENTLVSLRREGIDIADAENTLTELFAAYENGLFVKAAIPEILKKIKTKDGKTAKSVESVIKENKLERITGRELEKIAKENGFDVQKIMQKYRLNIEPADLKNIGK